MSREYRIGIAAAIVVHAVVLFGVKPGHFTPARQDATKQGGEVEVSLVADAGDTPPEPEPPPVVAALQGEAEPPPAVEPVAPVPEPPVVESAPKPEDVPPAEPVEPVPAAPEVAVAAAPPPVPVPQSNASFESRVAAASPAPSVAASDVFTTREPDYLRRAEVYYPRAARLQGQEGLVVLRLHIDEEGRVEKIEVKSSSGHRLLDKAAIDAARRAKYRAAKSGDKFVPSVTEAPYRFVLTDEEPRRRE